ncbi:MAG TPA: phenylalanine--tRNA ligase subunit beta [Burkholderiales bacterium]|nr:phenylalanine--tRNA ligase subunit beta [Burkholderiales bacterium]
MKFLENWLRSFVDPALTDRELAEVLTMSGIEVESVEPAGSDRIFTIKPTPNRGDCLSVIGIAREVAAVTGSKLMPPDTVAVPATIADRVEVALEAPTACPRYCARVIRGVDPRAVTPDWMVTRLERCGLRSVHAIVDVTNYVMLEFGQPLHAFDFARIDGGIHVRFGRGGETLKLLNGQQVTLDDRLLVIADYEKPLALAGIMGGEDSAVVMGTTAILLESAFFQPESIAGKSRVLGFGSDSAYRFERGVDFAATRSAIEYATRLMLEICGGRAGPVCETGASLPQRKPVQLRQKRVERVLGVALNERQIIEILQRLGFAHRVQGAELAVTPPSYRFDLAIEEDLIEEIARIHGYDNIPARRPGGAARMLPVDRGRAGVGKLRSLLVARDYQEVITYSFVNRRWEEDFYSNHEPVPLLNPIAVHLNVMRSSLIASLVDCLKLNINRQHDRVRLFEIGHCFARGEKQGYRQSLRLAALACGEALPEQWGITKRGTDFFDVKSDLEALLVPDVVHLEPAQHPALHPGRSAAVSINGTLVGWMGELHPRLCQQYDLLLAPVLFELNLDARKFSQVTVYKNISKFPVVRRDISVEIVANATWEAILIALRKNAPATLLEIMPFDIYRGKGIDSDKKSIAFRLLLQDTSKTLTDAEVDLVIEQFIKVLEEEFNAVLRK